MDAKDFSLSLASTLVDKIQDPKSGFSFALVVFNLDPSAREKACAHLQRACEDFSEYEELIRYSAKVASIKKTPWIKNDLYRLKFDQRVLEEDALTVISFFCFVINSVVCTTLGFAVDKRDGSPEDSPTQEVETLLQGWDSDLSQSSGRRLSDLYLKYRANTQAHNFSLLTKLAFTLTDDFDDFFKSFRDDPIYDDSWDLQGREDLGYDLFSQVLTTFVQLSLFAHHFDISIDKLYEDTLATIPEGFSSIVTSLSQIEIDIPSAIKKTV